MQVSQDDKQGVHWWQRAQAARSRSLADFLGEARLVGRDAEFLSPSFARSPFLVHPSHTFSHVSRMNTCWPSVS